MLRQYSCTAMNTDALAFDHTAALESTGGDRELFDEIARIFLEDAPRLKDQIKQAVSRGDAKALRRDAHMLKGSACHFAAPGVVIAAQDLELLGETENLDGAKAALVTLDSALERVLHALRDFLSRPIEY
jgi:HPt (histidine-containing phosphotransfer) domain-containing protein